MYRLRFENIKQIFGVPADCELLIPLSELFECTKDGKLPESLSGRRIIAEIPSVIWENGIGRVRKQLESVKAAGICDALCENIGAVSLCRELGIKMHGGMYLNVLNTQAAAGYASMGLEDMTLSFEMPFNKMRVFIDNAKRAEGPENGMSYGIVIYGYLPLMKFRACPAMGPKGCSGCTKSNYLTDRTDARFRIICRNSEYSELLNSVPLYAADKAVPNVDFQTLYFTTENRSGCEEIFRMVQNRETPSFARTAGLYGRELL